MKNTRLRGEHENRTEPPVAGRRILLVDDDAGFRFVVRKIFARVPHEFIEAGDGETGFRAARSQPPAVIFLDLAMPCMNGFETLEQLRSVPETRDIPVIVCSSLLLSTPERQQLDAGHATVLSKDLFAKGAALPAIRGILAAIGLSNLLPEERPAVS